MNGNCIYDFSDATIHYNPATIRVDSAGVPVDTITTTSWVYYLAHGPIGTVYTFHVITNPHGFLPSCPTTGITSVTLTSTYGVFVDTMGFICDTTACTDHATFSWFSPGLTGAGAHINVLTSSCTPVALTAKLTFSPKYTFSYVYGCSSYSLSGNVLTMNFSSVAASSPGGAIAVFNPVGTLTIGDTVQTRLRVDPFTGDCDTTNNIMVSVDTIRSSWDPNHKTVTPMGIIAPGTRLEYMIGFENTGNDTAHNIHIQDTLSTNLDVSTFTMVGSSARVITTFSTWSGHTVVKFDFPGINLLDSSHHGLADGWVSYAINAKTSLVPGTTIDNKAGIYFDVNPVVMTNPVENLIGTTTAIGKVSNAVVAIYPNPANDELTVAVNSGSYNTLQVTNMMGQVIATKQVDGKINKVDVKSLPSGIYYIVLKGEDGVKVQKFEKL